MQPIDDLIAALREELQQYGEMLARLDDQQEHVVLRHAEDLMASVDAVQSQAATIQRARRHREELQTQAALDARLPGESPLRDLLPRIPSEYRPLVDALVQENNQLLFRVQQRARQNHLLLSRSLELMHGFLGSLGPSTQGPLYGDSGKVSIEAPALPSLYEAVG